MPNEYLQNATSDASAPMVPQSQENPPVIHHRWLRRLGIFAVCILILFGAIFGAAWWANAAPAKVAYEFTNDLIQNKITDAYALSSSAFQSSTSRDEMAQFVSQEDKIAQIKSIFFNSRERDNDTAKMMGTVTTNDGQKYPIEVDLVKESGKWKVVYFNIGFEATEQQAAPEQ